MRVLRSGSARHRFRMLVSLCCLLLPVVGASAATKPSKSAKKPDAIVQNGFVTRVGLVALAQYKESDRPADPFTKSSGPRNQFEGAPFMFAMPVSGEEDTNPSPARWRYDIDHQKMFLSFSAHAETYVLLSQSLSERYHEGKSYIGQNAFGVKRKITPAGSLSVGLHYVSVPDGPLEDSLEDTDPEEGRALSKNLIVLLSGTIGSFDDGKSSRCEDSHAGATIDDPTDVYMRSCAVAVRLDKIHFVDLRDKSNILAWDVNYAPKQPKP